MDSTASFHYATGGHYITMLPADWSISTSHDPSLHVSLVKDAMESFWLGNWRALHHHAPRWLVNIHITWPFCPPVSMVKDAMESIYTSILVLKHAMSVYSGDTHWQPMKQLMSSSRWWALQTNQPARINLLTSLQTLLGINSWISINNLPLKHQFTSKVPNSWMLWVHPSASTCQPLTSSAEATPVSCPDPALSRGKGSGDYWAISWLCRLSSIDFERTLSTCLHDVRPISLVHAHAWMTWHYFIGLSKIKTVDSAQPRNRSIVTS